VVLPDGPPSLSADMTPPVITLAVREWYQRAGNGDVKPRRKKAPASRPGSPSVRGKGSSEHEGIICKVLGGELLCARHQRERIHWSDGSAGLRV
jgi:hypothetical protein